MTYIHYIAIITAAITLAVALMEIFVAIGCYFDKDNKD